MKPRLGLMRTLVPAAALALSATAIVAPVAIAAPRQNAASSGLCGYVNVKWSIKGYSGKQYQVTAFGGVSCKLALRLAPGLIKEKPHGSGGFITPPKGFKCQTLPASTPVSYGGCDAIGHAHQVFNWSPRQI